MARLPLILALVACSLCLLPACGGSDGTAADKLGVGAQCVDNSECVQTPKPQTCLTTFKGGYCGIVGCTTDTDCPDSSMCVNDGSVGATNYCFRTCATAADCNAHRDPANAANCVGNQTSAVTGKSTTTKVCVPPSSGV